MFTMQGWANILQLKIHDCRKQNESDRQRKYNSKASNRLISVMPSQRWFNYDLKTLSQLQFIVTTFVCFMLYICSHVQNFESLDINGKIATSFESNHVTHYIIILLKVNRRHIGSNPLAWYWGCFNPASIHERARQTHLFSSLHPEIQECRDTMSSQTCDETVETCCADSSSVW